MKGSVFFALEALANDAHRRPVEGEKMHWRQRYDHAKIEEDSPFLHMVRLCKQLGAVNDIVIVTSTPFAVYEPTVKWIHDQGVKFETVYMKENLEERPADETKLDLIRRAFQEGWKPWLIVDSDPSVIDEINGFRGIQGLLVPY